MLCQQQELLSELHIHCIMHICMHPSKQHNYSISAVFTLREAMMTTAVSANSVSGMCICYLNAYTSMDLTMALCMPKRAACPFLPAAASRLPHTSTLQHQVDCSGEPQWKLDINQGGLGTLSMQAGCSSTPASAADQQASKLP